MSLHNLAQHLQTAGRGDDKMLVHMTPKEVGGLQALAMAHGGSLTVNPQTGLPEAGFLKNLLPTIIGAGLSMIPGVGPLMAAGITGAGYGLATGDLGKGLMAGLGAYGGAGLTSGLSAAGADAAATAATSKMIDPATNALASGVTPEVFSKTAQEAAAAAAKTPGATAWEGVKALGTEGGRSAFMGGMGAVPYAGYAGLGSMAMSNYYDELEKMGKLAGNKEKALMRPYDLKRDYSSVPDIYGRYFRDKYTEKTPYEAPGPEYAADGGLMGLGTNLPVEQMSQANAIGANTRYPMAYQTTSTYASPAERPISENLINPPGYTPTDPYTGAQRFADGGEARYSTPGGGSIPAYIPKGADPYAPQYAIQEGSTNIAPAAAPATATATAAAAPTTAPAAAPIRFTKQKKIADAEMIQNVFERLGGFGDVQDVAPDLYDKLIANKRSEQDIASFFRKSPYFSSAKYEDGDYEGRIQDVANAALGRNATPEEVAKLSAKPRSMKDLYTWFRTTQPQEFEKTTKSIQQTRIETNPKNFATDTQVAGAFQSMLGRPPTAAELKEYSGLTPDKLQEKIKASDLYKQKLTGEASSVRTPKFTTDKMGQQRLEGALSAPKSATERLGLGQFYGDMDKALKDQMATASQGMRFKAPTAQTNLSALDQYYAPAGTNIAQGSAEQAQLASLLAAQNVAKQASLYGIGPTVARAGAPGISAPRFTSSGNIYSAGFYSPQFGSATAPATPFGAPSMNLPPVPKAQGGIATLGDYSDGGRLLKGPGDGVSDSIPASIGDRRPARLADGEFVVPARIVSELGNGSTEAGARQLYAMMDRIQNARRKSVGKGKVAVDSKSSKLLPA